MQTQTQNQFYFFFKKTFQTSVSSMQRKKNEHFKLNCYAIFLLSSLCMYKTYITYVRHLIWNHALENLHCKFANIQRLNLSAINLIYCTQMIYVLQGETFNNEMVDAITHCSLEFKMKQYLQLLKRLNGTHSSYFAFITLYKSTFTMLHLYLHHCTIFFLVILQCTKNFFFFDLRF